MAFIFVPGPDGSFTEGDKQTNPDTGVEYIYHEGAWRALGPATLKMSLILSTTAM